VRRRTLFPIVAWLVGSTLGMDQRGLAVAEYQKPSPEIDETEALFLENAELRKTAAELLQQIGFLRHALQGQAKKTAQRNRGENLGAD
jgi:hypothetical protein